MQKVFRDDNISKILRRKKNAKLDILKLRTFALRKTLKKIKRQATEKCFIYI